MNIFYCCKDGIYSSKIMAAIHLKKIPLEKDALSIDKILSVKGFGEEIKEIEFFGVDFMGNKIFVLKDKENFSVLKKLIENFLRIHYISEKNILLIKAPKITSSWLFAGGKLFKFKKKLEKYLMAQWIRKNYKLFIDKYLETIQKLD